MTSLFFFFAFAFVISIRVSSWHLMRSVALPIFITIRRDLSKSSIGAKDRQNQIKRTDQIAHCQPPFAPMGEICLSGYNLAA